MKFRINTNNVEEWRSCITLLLALGYVWHRSVRRGYTTNLTLKEIEQEYYSDYNHIYVTVDSKDIAGIGYRGLGEDYLDAKKDFYNIFIKATDVSTIVVGNVGIYEARVTKEDIRVGCQTISHEKFAEIAVAVEKLRN